MEAKNEKTHLNYSALCNGCAPLRMRLRGSGQIQLRRQRSTADADRSRQRRSGGFAAPEDNAAENEQKTLAESYIGKEVSELYDAIGEPESVSYASSCLGSGEDGELVYNGFTVYTYKEGDSEVVQNVQ